MITLAHVRERVDICPVQSPDWQGIFIVLSRLLRLAYLCHMATEVQNRINTLSDKLEQLEKDLKLFAKVAQRDVLHALPYYLAVRGLAKSGEVSRLKIYRDAQGKAQVQKDPFLAASIRSYVRKRGGEIEGISFGFARHGIYWEHGVGRGRSKGSAQASKNKHPWLALVLPHITTELADYLAEYYADIAVNELRISVPGITTTIK